MCVCLCVCLCVCALVCVCECVLVCVHVSVCVQQWTLRPLRWCPDSLGFILDVWSEPRAQVGLEPNQCFTLLVHTERPNGLLPSVA